MKKEGVMYVCKYETIAVMSIDLLAILFFLSKNCFLYEYSQLMHNGKVLVLCYQLFIRGYVCKKHRYICSAPRRMYVSVFDFITHRSDTNK